VKIRNWIIILSYIISIYPAKAQIHHGGFGNFFIGPLYNLSSSLQKDLNSVELIDGNLQLNTITWSYGGAGYSIRPKGIVIGGSGYTYKLTSYGNNGEVVLHNGCGFFNVGYRILNKNKWLGFPYCGMGGYGASFKITNTTSDKIFIIGNDTITSHNAAKYSTGGLAFEIGFGLKYFAFNSERKKNNKGTGTVFGIDGGLSFFPSFAKWQNIVSEDEIASLETPFIMTAYIRMTIGLGIFFEEGSEELPGSNY